MGMPMKKTIPTRQGGFLMLALLAALLFFAAATVFLDFRNQVVRQQQAKADAFPVNQVREALQKYAATNRQSFRDGKEIMYVADQYRPTIAELRNLGYLTATGVEINAPFGATYATTLKLEPNGSISGMVYLTGNVRTAAGAPDQPRACRIAQALGDLGVCSNPGAPQFLGNSQVAQFANPTGLPAIFGALVFVTT